MSKVSYLGRVARLSLRHPVEAVDRFRDRVQQARSRSAPTRYGADPDWRQELHRVLDAPWPCPYEGDFHRLWGTLTATLDGFPEGHDADEVLAGTVYCCVRHSEPKRVVETGVARGVTSRCVLEAMGEGSGGKLWSIDLPPVLEGWHEQSRVAVPQELRSAWTYIRGSTHRKLGPLLDSLGTIDVFIHDSLHTENNVRFELDSAWSALEAGGILVVGGITRAPWFGAFLGRHGPGRWVVCGPPDPFSSGSEVGVVRR